MLDKLFIDRVKKTAIFIGVYTVLYILFFATLPYTIPFVLAFLVALLISPINRFIQRKLKISNGIASIITTIIFFTLVCTIILYVLYLILVEAIAIVTRIPSIDTIMLSIRQLIDKSTLYFVQLDPTILEKIYDYLNTMLNFGLSIAGKVLNSSLSFILSLPGILIVGFISLLATYLFTKDMKIFNNYFYSIFSFEGKSRMENIIKQSTSMILKYIKSYSTVLFITFIETLVGFTILGIEYAVSLSIFIVIMDLMPIIGPSIVYIPLALYYYLMGNTFKAIGLIVLLGVVTVVRQIVEPKLVSSTLDIHPIMILVSIFVGLKAYGFIGMIFLIGLIIFYKILVKVEVL